MIFFSSAEVYGDYNGIMSEDVMETNPIKDTYQMNDYAVSKWAGELNVYEFCSHVRYRDGEC